MRALQLIVLASFPAFVFAELPSMTREASGTSWQPESAPMEMRHSMHGEWMLMTMAFANAVYTDSKARARGGDNFFVSSMGMLVAQRALGTGSLQLRGMLSLDPLLVGKSGYPLLLQTGETVDGATHLIDRQHPHDLFAELAAAYSLPLTKDRSVFVYAGLPGEPALGPPTFLHRVSGMDGPEAPLSHHWFDSSHITFGVVTAGVTSKTLKLEASIFNGREPDEDRYDIEVRPLTSWSARASWNPTANWSGQVSFGRLQGPEQLEPDVDIDRSTASVTYNRPMSGSNWQTTLAAARNEKRPGAATNAWLLESAWSFAGHYTLFARAERVSKDELFTEEEPLHDQSFTVKKVTLGGVWDFARDRVGSYGVGAQYNWHFIPQTLATAYGDDPTSWLIFVRWRARS